MTNMDNIIKMATSRDVLCGICEAQYITKYADQWCPECDEGLCSECENHHRVSKATKDHGVISIENYYKLPSSISEIGNHCCYHDMKYTLFCQFHDKPCCLDCISTNHKDCAGLLSIREIIKTSKTSTLIDNIEQSLTDIKNNTDKIMKNRQQNLSEIRQQRQMFQDQIKQMRVKIDSHLDTLERTILQELDDTEEKIKSKIDNLLKQLSHNSKTIEGLQSDIRAVKEYASDLQTFLGSKAIEEEVKKEEENLMALSEDGCLQELNLRYNINTQIKDILSTITTFGSVSIETSPPTVVIQTTKDKQAQIISAIQHSSVMSINNIKLTLRDEKEGPPGDSWRDRGRRDEWRPLASSWRDRAAASDESGPSRDFDKGPPTDRDDRRPSRDFRDDRGPSRDFIVNRGPSRYDREERSPWRRGGDSDRWGSSRDSHIKDRWDDRAPPSRDDRYPPPREREDNWRRGGRGGGADDRSWRSWRDKQTDNKEKKSESGDDK